MKYFERIRRINALYSTTNYSDKSLYLFHKIFTLRWHNYIFLLLISFGCNKQLQIKDGETAYLYKQYAEAARLLKKEYNDTKSKSQKARTSYLLGKSYEKLLDYNAALVWYTEANKLEYGIESMFAYAKVLKSIEDYVGAIETYRKIAERIDQKQQVNREINLCLQAIEFKNNPTSYRIEPIKENSTTSDYAPAFFGDQYLVFTSDRHTSTGKDIYKWTGQKYSDLFILNVNGSDVRRFDSAINSGYNEGSAWFSKDMSRMYFTRCSPEDQGDVRCKIFESKKIDGFWSDGQILPFIDENYNFGQPTLIENDSVLVFATDYKDENNYKNLYYSVLNQDGTWEDIEPMPSSINSPGNELFPTGDGDTLYFSSDYLPGLGGFDIFKTYLKSDGSWATPSNMGYPINSGADDFSYLVNYNSKNRFNIERQGYFVSSRGGHERDNIYKFFKQKLEKPVPIDEDKIKSKNKKELYIAIKSYSPRYEDPSNPNSRLVGRDLLPNTNLQLRIGDNTPVDGITSKDAYYITKASFDKAIELRYSKIGYLTSSILLEGIKEDTLDNSSTQTFNVDILLIPIILNQEFVLDNIYYDYDKWDIKTEAMPALEALVKIMLENPKLKIQLSSHTDCRGDAEYNKDLSQKRAQSAMDFITNRGVDRSRLSAIGYGKSKLLDNCTCGECTEEQHQKNRRTTFMIVQ